MKRAGFILLLLFILNLPCQVKSNPADSVEQDSVKTFIYHIPDEDKNEMLQPEDEIPQDNEEQDITSDDITADTSRKTETTDESDDDDSSIISSEYEIDDMYSDVLKGYAVYDEYEADTISLEDDIKDFQALNIKLPGKIKGSKYTATREIPAYSTTSKYSKFNNIEYSIAPLSSTNYRKKGGFSAGTTFNQGIDFAELEQSTGVFSRYENKYFAISTAYAKTVNSTNNNYNDNFYFSPELKLNQYFTLKEILSADITRNRKKAEVILSINPFGSKDPDRLRFEIGANATYDDTNSLLKNQVKFSTNFKL